MTIPENTRPNSFKTWATVVDETVDGGEALQLTSKPVIEPFTDGKWQFDWTPERSGWASVDGPVFDWDEDWLEAYIIDPLIGTNAVDAVSYGYWHLSKTMTKPDPGSTGPDSSPNWHEERSSLPGFFEKGRTYTVIVDGSFSIASSVDVTNTLASISHLGGLSGRGINGVTFPSNFPGIPSRDVIIKALSGGLSDNPEQFGLALGRNSAVKAVHAFAFGEKLHAEGRWSHVTGRNNLASGDYATAKGDSNVASAMAANASGWQTIASGQHSNARGRSTTAEGNNSESMGQLSVARWESSQALAAGSFDGNSRGEAQHQRVVRKSTSNVPMDAGALPDNFTAQFEAMVVSHSPDGTSKKAWKLSGLVSTVGTPLLVPGFVKEVVGEDGTTIDWDLDVSLNGNSLRLTPTNRPLVARNAAYFEFLELGV